MTVLPFVRSRMTDVDAYAIAGCVSGWAGLACEVPSPADRRVVSACAFGAVWDVRSPEEMGLRLEAGIAIGLRRQPGDPPGFLNAAARRSPTPLNLANSLVFERVFD